MVEVPAGARVPVCVKGTWESWKLEVGSVGDAATWNRCSLQLNTASHLALPHNMEPFIFKGVNILPYLVADGAFKLTEQVMKCSIPSSPLLSSSISIMLSLGLGVWLSVRLEG